MNRAGVGVETYAGAEADKMKKTKRVVEGRVDRDTVPCKGRI